MLKHIKRNFLKAFDDCRGNVGILFAVSLFPMIGIVGLGVDVSRTLMVKTVLDASADAAALSAVTQAEATLQSPIGAGSSGLATAEYAGQLAGQRIFTVNGTRASLMVSGGTPIPIVSVSPSPVNPNTLTAKVNYSGVVPTIFGGMFGVRTLAVSGTASSSLTMPTYMNISVAVDVSQSMGLASTPTYMAQLQSLTGGCAFGCHVYQAGQSGTDSYEAQAEAAGIQLRIDVIRLATQNMIATAQKGPGAGLISFGLYELQGGPGAPLTTLSSPSINYDALEIAAKSIDLGPNTSAGIGDTDYVDSMPALTKLVPASGTGASAATAQQFVFLMTDGVQDIAGNCTDGHCTQAFDPSQCAALKNAGVTVGVIYTTYLAMPTEQTYLDLVAPFASNLAPNLQKCATSPSWFYQATDASDIQAAITALFAKATGHGTLTQ